MCVVVKLLVMSVVVLAASGVPQRDETYCDAWCRESPGSERFVCCKDIIDPPVSHSTNCSCDNYGYTGKCGESGWNKHCPSCAGRMQSPINLYPQNTAEITGYEFNYTNYNQVPLFIGCFNNGGDYVECEWHTITDQERPTISGGNLTGTYIFASMHWHIGCEDGVGSDHTVENKSFSGELHLIHYKNTYTSLSMALNSGDRDALAVFGVFLNVNGIFNKAYKQITDAIDYININGGDKRFNYNSPLSDLLPAIGGGGPYYRYYGSLTHPACNEVVVWTVFIAPSFIDKSQIRAFRRLKVGPDNGSMEPADTPLCNNHRKIQLQNGREITVWGI